MRLYHQLILEMHCRRPQQKASPALIGPEAHFYSDNLWHLS